MPYICMYTLMDHVDQLSQPSTNSHQLAPLGGVTYGTGWDTGHGTKGDIFAELAYILKKKFGTTTKCSSLKGLRTTRASQISATEISSNHRELHGAIFWCSWVASRCSTTGALSLNAAQSPRLEDLVPCPARAPAITVQECLVSISSDVAAREVADVLFLSVPGQSRG